MNTRFGNNKEWFEKLVNCAKKYKLKIQPFGLLVLDSHSIHLLEDVDIEYICELKIYVNNPVKIDLSKIKSPIQRITMVEQRSYCDIDSITLQKTPVITTHIDLYTGWEGLQNVKNMKCFNLITNESRGAFLIDPKNEIVNSNHLQQFVDNNPNVTNFYIRTTMKRREKYYQVKLEGREVVDIMDKSENALISKGVLEDFYLKNTDFRQWYEKHM